MITPEDKRRAEQAAEELDYHGEQFAPLDEDSRIRNARLLRHAISVPAKDPSTLESDAVSQSKGAAGDGALPTTIMPSPAPLEVEFERLRKLLRKDHQLVGMRLRELAEAQHRDGWPDKDAFKTGLLRLSNETREMEQLLLNIQLATAFPIPPGVIHEHGTAKLKRHL